MQDVQDCNSVVARAVSRWTKFVDMTNLFNQGYKIGDFGSSAFTGDFVSIPPSHPILNVQATCFVLIFKSSGAVIMFLLPTLSWRHSSGIALTDRLSDILSISVSALYLSPESD
jgi:hypothetical protein